MLDHFEFEPVVREELLNFIVANQDRLRELSLRMVLKVAQLRKAMPLQWQAYARQTCMKRA